MKIIVDRDLCEANAVCVMKAPDVFLVNEESQMVVLQERPGPDLTAQEIGRASCRERVCMLV